MPYTTVVAGTTVTSSWANTNVRDQVVTPFANAAARTSAILTPIEGMVTYLSDVNRVDFYNGSAWQPATSVAAKVSRTTLQLVGSAGNVAVEWQSVIYDGYSMWSAGNPTRLTAPWTGFYAPSATISWDSSSGGIFRRTGLYLNGTFEDQQTDQLNNTADLTALRQNVCASGVKMTAGQYFEVQVTQDSGALRGVDAVTSNFKLVYLGPVA